MSIKDKLENLKKETHRFTIEIPKYDEDDQQEIHERIAAALIHITGHDISKDKMNENKKELD